MNDSAKRALLLVTSLLVIKASRQSDENLELKYRLEEEPEIGTYVGDVRQDTSLTRFYEPAVLQLLQFRFLRQQLQQTFSIDVSTGIIRTSGRVDRDTLCPAAETCLVKLDVAVQPAQYFRIIRVTILILDLNDNAPRFPEPKLHFEILESATVGTGLVIPGAIDPDSPDFAVRGYRELTDSDTFGLREVRKSVTSSGSLPVSELRLVLTRPLDREQIDKYRVKIMAADGGIPPRTGVVEISIDVIDVNDFSPVFEKTAYEVSIPENIPPRTVLTRLTATDADTGINGQVVYELSSLTASSYGNVFAVSNSTGDVYVVGAIDFEQFPVYQLVIIARDLGPDSVPASVTLTVKVTDVNDNAPEINIDTLTGSSGVAVTSEDAAVDTFVAHVAVTDKDTGSAGRVECFVNDGYFRLKPIPNSAGATSGSGGRVSEYQLVTAASLDRESQAFYDVGIVCRDMGPEPRVTVERIQVRIDDVNDNDPQFRAAQYRAELIENNYVGAVVLNVNATDLDYGDNGLVTYALDGSDSSGFRIEPESGVIKATVSFDRELGSVYKFYVIAIDSGKTVSRSSSVPVSIDILDVNDHAPQFTKERYSFVVQENMPSGAEVGKVAAIDRDAGLHGQVIYSIQSELFSIDRQSGRIETIRSLDREHQSMHHVTVMASDLGVPPTSSLTDITIYIGDVNDNPPVFERHGRDANATYFVSTRARPGHVITRLRARDSDIDGNARVTYELTSLVEKTTYGDQSVSGADLFDVDPVHGALRVAGSLTYSDGSTYEMAVTARDDGTPSLSATIRVLVTVNSSVSEVSAATAEGRRSSLTKHNLIVVIALALISGFVTICLVVAIVCIRRGGTDRRRKSKPISGMHDDNDRKYNGHLEAMCSALPTTIPDDSMEDSSFGVFKRPEVTFCKEMDAKPSRTMDENCQSLYKVENNHTKNWPSNQVIQRLKNVDILDGVSLESNDEGSNTDSGRGPSEVDGLLAAESRSVPSRQSPSAGTPISASNTVPTETVLPIKPCLATDNSRLANHIGHPLSTVPEDCTCSGTIIDRYDNRCHGNGVALQGNCGSVRSSRTFGPPTLSKPRRTVAAPRKCLRLANGNEIEHSPGAIMSADCLTSLPRSPRRADGQMPKLRIISDDYDIENNECHRSPMTSGLVVDGSGNNEEIPQPLPYPLGVRLTTV